MSNIKNVVFSAIVASLAIAAPVTSAASTTAMPVSTSDTAADSGTLRLFISGHSLTDRPVPDYFKEFAAADGVEIVWQMQSLQGSSILQRLNDKNAPFEAAVPGEHGNAYDLMFITEQHRVLDSLIWQNTVRSLRTYQDRFVSANGGGQSYFYSPWISLSDLSDPGDWIAFEKEALPIWQCVVGDVNRNIAAAGRADRIRFIPTSWALARLAEHLTTVADVPAFEGLSTRQRLEAIFSDDVHLTPLGAYYVAAISYGTVRPGNLPALSPPSLDPGQAKSVLDFATAFLADYAKTPGVSDEMCSAGVPLAFSSHYTAYTERTYHRKEEGFVSARIKRLRDTMRFAWRLRGSFE